MSNSATFCAEISSTYLAQLLIKKLLQLKNFFRQNQKSCDDEDLANVIYPVSF